MPAARMSRAATALLPSRRTFLVSDVAATAATGRYSGPDRDLLPPATSLQNPAPGIGDVGSVSSGLRAKIRASRILAAPFPNETTVSILTFNKQIGSAF